MQQIKTEMKHRHKKTGFSLLEIAIVISIMMIMATIIIPAAKALFASFQDSGGSRTIISTAMTAARSIAAKNQRYAGIRLQRNSAGEQYIIFIIHNPEETGLASGFRAVEGYKPIKLPAGAAVTDLRVRTNHGVNSLDAMDTSDTPVITEHFDNNAQNFDTYGNNIYLTDMSCFSIIFSPNGNLVIHDVRVRNKDGIYQPDNAIINKTSKDDVFNSPENIKLFNVGMFIQDDYAQLGLAAEQSRNMFVIYDVEQFNKMDSQEKINYLSSQKPTYINPYTGTIVGR